MAGQHLRKLQEHGTGKEVRVPPEVCEKLEITSGDNIEFDIEPGADGVTLRKGGTSHKRRAKREPKAVNVENAKNAIAKKYGDSVCIICGGPGSGKTQLAKTFHQNLKRLVIYDSRGKHNRGLVFDNVAKLNDFWQYQARAGDPNFRLIYKPVKPKADFHSVCELVIPHEPLTFLVEDVDWYCKPGISPAFQKIIESGNIQLIGTTEKASEIDFFLTSNRRGDPAAEIPPGRSHSRQETT